MKRPKPKSDFAKQAEVAHVFPAWVYFGDPRCSRCHRALSEVERTGAPCASDKAIELGKVFRRTTR